MNIKTLLFFALLISSFSSRTMHAMDGGGASNAGWIGVGLVLAQAAYHASGAFANFYSVSNNKTQTTMALEKHTEEKPTAKISTFNQYATGIYANHDALTKALARKGSNREVIKKDLEENEKCQRNMFYFLQQGLPEEQFDPKKDYRPKDTEANDPTKSKSNDKTNVAKEPGFFKKSARALLVPLTLAQSALHRAADILPVNALLNRIAEHEKLKDTFFDQHKKDIGGALVAATTAALIYKVYSWYHNEERIAAGNSVIELEEQERMIAQQYKQEMKRTDLSKEDKVKLKKACLQYMKQLKENIHQQKIAAGYNVYRNFLIGAVVAAIGLPVLLKYYPDELKKIFFPQEQQNSKSTNDELTTSNECIIPLSTTPADGANTNEVLTPSSNPDNATSEQNNKQDKDDNQKHEVNKPASEPQEIEATGTSLMQQDIDRFIKKPMTQCWNFVKASPQAIVNWWKVPYPLQT